MFGALFKDGGSFKLITSGYKMLNFAGAGYTSHYSGIIYSVTFPCPTFPIIFIRGAKINLYTAVHSLQDHKNGTYTLYTLGEAEVFVFTEKTNVSRYGLELYDKAGNVIYNSSNKPVRPVSVVRFPPMEKGQSVSWKSTLGARKLAYCLSGNRGHWEFDLGPKTVDVWRDVVQSVSGGFILHSQRLTNKEYYKNPIPRNGFAQANKIPIDMTVIDVHDLNFPHRDPKSFY